MVALLDELFISNDPGNGWAAAYRIVKGKVQTNGIPHVRARVTGKKLDADLGGQNTIEYVDFCGNRYGIGDGIWNLTDAPIETHRNTERRYGSPMHIFLIMTNIAMMNVKSGSDLSLIVPAPPGLVNKVKPIIQQALLAGESGAGDGMWTIQLRGDKKPRQYKVKRIIVMPEGAGAFGAFRWNITGDVMPLPIQNRDALDGRVTVLDLGAGTGDEYTMYNGSLNADNIDHATDSKAGVIYNIQTPVMQDIIDMVPSAKSHLTTAQVDSYLRRYLTHRTTDSANVLISGQTINIEQSIIRHSFAYAELIMSTKIDPLFAAGNDAIVMAGGGWAYIQGEVERQFSNRVLINPTMFKHTASIPLWDLNGIGQLHFAAAVMKSQQV